MGGKAKGKSGRDEELPAPRDPWSARLSEFEFGEYPYAKSMKRREYEEELHMLQIELLKVQRWAIATNQKIVTIFEGRDAAGKGGTIKRFMEYINPRGAKVVALLKPTEHERGQWYFQRYVDHLPSNGEIVLFDRSWYNRAGVEPVMGFCTPEEHQEFLRQCPEFERMLVRSGIWLIKFWLTVDKDEQRKRLDARKEDPLKRWKLSPIDEAAAKKFDEFSAARDTMFDATDTVHAPWTVVKSQDKKRARLNCMRYFLRSLPYTGRDDTIVQQPDPLILRARAQMGA